MKNKGHKLKRMSRRNLILSAIYYLEKETGFHAYNIRWGDGYIVETGKDVICWFCFKEVKGYTFAIWHKDECSPKNISPEFEDAELIFFTQADITRDKFKPSRSALKTCMFRYTWKDNDKDYWEEDWNDCGASDMVKFIKEHKYRAFFIQSYSDWDPWDYISGFDAFKEYYKTIYYDWKIKTKEKLKIKRISKDIINRLKYINGCRFTLSTYDDTYPELNMFIYFRSKNSDDITKYNEIMNYIEDKYWNYVNINYIDNLEKFKRFYKYRIKNDGKGETLLWKKI